MKTEVGIIKVEISVPEAIQALEQFKENRLKAFEALTTEVRTAVGNAIDNLLHTEMSLFLGKPEQTSNKRNGYKEREYALKGIGCVQIRMPKDRLSKFSSQVVPAREQIDPRLKQDMAVLHLAGLSTRTMAMMSKRVLGIAVGKDTVSQSLGMIEEKALGFLTRTLTSKKYWALYVDGTNFNIQRRGSVKKEPSLVVLGLDERNCYSILAVEPGTKDNVEAWSAVFSELRRRGLNMGAVRVGIMDGLPGLEKLFVQTFPNSVTARCWVHSLRNVMAKTPERFRAAFKAILDRIMYASSEDAARRVFLELKTVMGNDAERAVHCLEKDLESLLVHYRFDKKFWRALKTTNPIERVNREFKRRTKSMDSLGERTLEILVAFTAIRLEFGWQTTPVDSSRLHNLESVQIQNRIEETTQLLMN